MQRKDMRFFWPLWETWLQAKFAKTPLVLDWMNSVRRRHVFNNAFFAAWMLGVWKEENAEGSSKFSSILKSCHFLVYNWFSFCFF
jgi:hypothetical protein